jgi:cytochrome c oxidase assembly protein subunit 15
MSRTWLRRLVLASALLVLVIVACSAYLRLAQSGLGCSEWPDCYAGIAVSQMQAGASPVPDAASPAGSAVVRGLHRISASVVSLLLMVILLMGWEGLGSLQTRLMAVLAVVLAAFLAWLGRFTPSMLPAVLLGNLLGGMVMTALLFALWRRLKAASSAASDKTTATPAAAEVLLGWLAGSLLLVQISLGGLIGARHAALACRGLTGCGNASGIDWSVFNPFSVVALAADHPALQALTVAHRVGAVLTAMVVVALAVRLLRAGAPKAHSGTLLLVLLASQGLLGAVATLMPSPLWAVLLHNLVAALLLAVVAGLVAGHERVSMAPEHR